MDSQVVQFALMRAAGGNRNEAVEYAEAVRLLELAEVEQAANPVAPTATPTTVDETSSANLLTAQATDPLTEQTSER